MGFNQGHTYGVCTVGSFLVGRQLDIGVCLGDDRWSHGNGWDPLGRVRREEPLRNTSGELALGNTNVLRSGYGKENPWSKPGEKWCPGSYGKSEFQGRSAQQYQMHQRGSRGRVLKHISIRFSNLEARGDFLKGWFSGMVGPETRLQWLEDRK